MRGSFSGSIITVAVAAAAVTTALGGTSVGTVTFNLPTGPLTVALKLSTPVSDPGPLWRLTNPVPVIRAFLDSRLAASPSTVPSPGLSESPAAPASGPTDSPAAPTLGPTEAPTAG